MEQKQTDGAALATIAAALEPIFRPIIAQTVEAILARQQPSELLTPKELAARLKVSDDWIYEQAAAGSLPCHRFGRNIRFSLAEVLAIRDQQKN
jgi:excisionase family DNA binding protein